MQRSWKKPVKYNLIAMASAGLLLLSACDVNLNTNGTINETDKITAGLTDSEADKIIDEMSMDEKISQMIIPAFRTWNEENVTDLESFPELKEALKKHQYGGVILFGANITGTEQVTRFLDDLQKNNRETGNASVHIPYLTAVDEEGGNVIRLNSGTRMTGNMAIGATEDAVLNAEKTGTVIGEELEAVGFNTDFAPDIDVNNNPSNPVIGTRSFSDDPTLVAELGTAYTTGLKRSNVIATYKHFPGHGDTETDSHIGTPSVEKTYEEIKETELVPFKNAIENGADMIMTAHITYPLIDDEVTFGDGITKGIYPATMSKKILTDILRKDMGYNGVVVTDALEMDAIRTAGLVPGEEDSAEYRINIAEKVINAGADILLLPADLKDSDAASFYDEYISGIAKKVEAGDISENRIDESVKRILSLKVKYGIADISRTRKTDNDSGIDIESRVAESLNIVGSDSHHETEMAMALDVITLLKNDSGLLPLSKDNGSIVVLSRLKDDAVTLSHAINGLKEKGIIDRDADIPIEYYYDPASDEKLHYPDEMKEKISSADVVIGFSHASGKNITDNESPQFIALKTAIEDTHKAGGRFVLISQNLPYDAAVYQDADAIILAYLGSGLNIDPTEKTESGSGLVARNANILAAVETVFGLNTPKGKLPVNVPVIEEQSDGTLAYGDEFLYERGYGLTYDDEKLTSGVSDELDGYTLEQVVILSRHNLRAPLSSNGSVPQELTPHKWINWSAGPSELTVKGGILETNMGQYFRKWLDKEGLISENSIPAPGEVRFYARDKQRCRATARYFASGLFPTADIPVEYPGAPYNYADFMKPNIHFYSDDYASAVEEQVAQMGGDAGFEGISEQTSGAIKLIMDTVDMKNSEAYRKGKYGNLMTDENGYTMSPGEEPDVTGPVKTASQVADALILQYYEDTDDRAAAFGHALSDKDWEKIGRFMTTYQKMRHGTPMVAVNITEPLLEELEDELKNEDRKLTFFCAHDCTLIGTLTALSAEPYELPGSIETMTPIGAKLMFERWRDEDGKVWYRVNLLYRSTDQIRNADVLSPDNPPLRYELSFEGVEMNEDGLISEEDLFRLFEKAFDTYYELEEEYTLNAAA